MSDAAVGPATPAASGAGAGASTQSAAQEEKQGDVEAGSAGGGASPSVRIKKPAPIYNKSGEVVEVPAATIAAIEGFVAPPGYKREGAREDSFLYSCGNYYVLTGVQRSASTFKAFFKCQLGACRTSSTKAISCKKANKSNANKHMKEKHGLQGTKGIVRVQNLQQKQGAITSAMEASATFRVGSSRVKELVAMELLVDKLLPICHFSGPRFKTLMAIAGDHDFPALPPKRVKHLLVEFYTATKKVVVGNMLAEVRKAPLPILHHMIDIWTDKRSGRKFLGVHVYYVTAAFEMKHALLCVKRYSPDQGALSEARASEVLLHIVKSILAEFGLRPSDLASGTTDSGSDVKAVSVNGLHAQHGALWNWCACHMAVKASEHAFGVSADPTKSKNPEARDVLKVVVKVVENLNKSPNLKKQFEDLQTDLLGEVFKIVKHAPQRWLSMARTLERIIRLWHVLRKLYSDKGRIFPLEEGDNKNGILQLYSLLEPLASITRDGQYGGAPMMADIYMKLGMLKTEALNPEKELKVYDVPAVGGDGLPDRQEQRKDLPHKMVAHDDLHPAAKKAREELRRALVSRLYGRYWDRSCVDPSFFVDASCLLTPPFSAGKHMSLMKLTDEEGEYLPAGSSVVAPTLDEEVEEKKGEVWDIVKERTIEALKEMQSRAEGSGDGAGEGGPFKRARTSGGNSASQSAGHDAFAGLCTSGVVAPSAASGDALEVQVANEILRYKGLQMSSADLQPNQVLNYWKQTGRLLFPNLKYVAQQTFGSQASAAQIERDFGTAGVLCASNRSRLDEYWVEMMLFLKVNIHCIPKYDDIPRIESNSIRECLPARFKGTDQDLLSAEMALDPLEDKTPPNMSSAVGDIVIVDG